MIDKPEQEFVFEVDSKPLIVNFDRGNYIIKEVTFDRTDEELGYQLLHDSDSMGRLRAAIELKTHATPSAEKSLAEAATRDSFWGVRVEAVKSLAERKSEAGRAAFIEALKDKDSRIRREALTGLATYSDPKLADLFIKTINTDPSYFAVAEAAKALGQTGSPQAYATLEASLKLESWHSTIRAGVLGGLAALKDPRTIDVGLKYSTESNPSDLRNAAFRILGEMGKGNDRALQALLSALKEKSSQIQIGAVQALAKLGDERAIPALEEASKSSELPAFGKLIITGAIHQIKAQNKQSEKQD
jgi:aminopeptidase N